MMYAFPATILAMLAYMFFHAGYRMRRERILGQRTASRKRWPFRQDGTGRGG